MPDVKNCVDCGKQIGRTSTRCNPCAAKVFGAQRTAHAKGNKYKLGSRLSEEHKKKIGQAGIGRHWSEEFRARFVRLRTGHPVSAETRAKISAGHRGRVLTEEHRAKLSAYRHTAEELEKMRGPNHWAYRDGRSSYPYPTTWKAIRQAIRRRDGGLCQHPDCYRPENGRHHDCHHIDRDKKDNRSENLILLCFKHHAETKKGNVDYWIEYYQAIQAERGIA